MQVVDAIGPGHRIWWPKITRFPLPRFQADTWNTALDQIDAERDDVWAWDWPAEMQSRPDVYASYDNTHLYPDGYRQRSAVMADAFTNAVAAARRVGGDVALPPTSGDPLGCRAARPGAACSTRARTRPGAGRRAHATVEVGDVVPAGLRGGRGQRHHGRPGRARVPRRAPVRPAGAPDDRASTRSADARRRRDRRLAADGRDLHPQSVATDVLVDLQAAFVPAATPAAAGLVPLDGTRAIGRHAV